MSSKFSIENFIKHDETSEKNFEASLKPEWLLESSDLVKKIYVEILKEVEFISTRMSNNDALTCKERTIIKSKIAEVCGVDRSYISNRRIPRIISFIDEKQAYLDGKWKYINTKQGARGLSKKQLEKEVTRLKLLLKYEKDKNYSELMTGVLINDVSKDQSRLVKQVAELKVQVNEHLESISRLRSQLRRDVVKVIDSK